MNTRLFLENFWTTEQKNELFVCMPFDDGFDEKFEMINTVARELGFICAKRTKDNVIGNDIVFEILDGITNSKTLLFDLSVDPKLAELSIEKFSKINENVLYEFGIASAVREATDVLLISQKLDFNRLFPFDISTTRINQYTGELNKVWLKERLSLTITEQALSKTKRITITAKLIDSMGLKLINLFSEITHFNDEQVPVEAKLGILRLLDLGIIFFNPGAQGKAYAYYWSDFGNDVIKYVKQKG